MLPEQSVDTSSRLQGALRALQASFGIIKRFPVLIPLGLITLFAQMTYSGINNVTLPEYIRSLHIRRVGTVIGNITAIFLLTETLLRLPFGWLSDRFGRARVIIGAMLLSVPSILLSGLVPGYLWLYPLRGWDGMMAAALWPSLFALIGDTIPERCRANAMGVINMMYMLALFAGGALAAVILEVTQQHRLYFFIGAGVFSIGALVATFFFLARPQLNQTHPEVHLEDAEQAVVSTSRHATLLSITFLQNFAITLIAPYMITYIRHDLGFSLGELGMLIGAPMLGVALFALPLSRLADAVGKVNAVRVAFTAVGIMLWLFASFQALPVLALTAMVLGVAFSMAIPAWLAIINSLAGSKTRGVTLAGYGTVQGMAAVLGPLLGGRIWDHIGHGSIFLASAITVSLAAFLTWVALPEHTRSSNKTAETV